MWRHVFRRKALGMRLSTTVGTTIRLLDKVTMLYIPRWMLQIVLLIGLVGTCWAYTHGQRPVAGLVVLVYVTALLIAHPETHRQK